MGLRAPDRDSGLRESPGLFVQCLRFRLQGLGSRGFRPIVSKMMYAEVPPEQTLLAGQGRDLCRGVRSIYAAVSNNWGAVKELKLSYYIGETLSYTTYTRW